MSTLPLITITLLMQARASQDQPVFVARFAEGGHDSWEEAKLARRSNRYSLSEVEEGFALHMRSLNAASAVWHPVDLPVDSGSVASWHWKIREPVGGERSERVKEGDDFAARLFVIFDGEPFTRGARAICYVWAATEPRGAKFRNPHFEAVETVVLRSGGTLAGEWVEERRNFLEDYREAFGESPRTVSAVAVMVDTDNTRSAAEAWFGDILIRRGRPR